MTRRSSAPLRADAVGLGLRPRHFVQLAEEGTARDHGIDCVEFICENFIGAADLPRRLVDRVARQVPVLAHAVSLNLLGSDPLDVTVLERMRRLLGWLGAPFATDHLAWTRSDGQSHHDLLPVPLSDELIPWGAARIRAVQAALDVPFGIENPSTYLGFCRDSRPEWDFLARLAEAADCGILLDVNNIYVASVNRGFDPRDYLAAIPWRRVLCVHVAGHTVRPDGLLHDTHDAPVADAVWDLYAAAWRLGGPFPTIIERDDNIPLLEALAAEVRRAREVRA